MAVNIGLVSALLESTTFGSPKSDISEWLMLSEQRKFSAWVTHAGDF